MSNAVVTQLCAVAADLARRGMTPATSSNFSARLDSDHCHVTVSGRDKGKLNADDFMLVDMQGQAIEPGRRASAETLLHTQIYSLRPQAQVVLHTHSMAQTLASMHWQSQGYVEFCQYELLKAFNGLTTHENSLKLPIVSNSQDMTALCDSVKPFFDDSNFYGYLIAGHGIYTWGNDLSEASRHLDAFEFLLSAELAKLGMKS
jgi:methylthioribulose-1-phosphate dehydratase